MDYGYDEPGNARGIGSISHDIMVEHVIHS